MPEQDVPEGFVPPKPQHAHSALPDNLNYSFSCLQVDFDKKLQSSFKGNEGKHIWFPEHCDGVEKVLQPLLPYQTS